MEEEGEGREAEAKARADQGLLDRLRSEGLSDALVQECAARLASLREEEARATLKSRAEGERALHLRSMCEAEEMTRASLFSLIVEEERAAELALERLERGQLAVRNARREKESLRLELEDLNAELAEEARKLSVNEATERERLQGVLKGWTKRG